MTKIKPHLVLHKVRGEPAWDVAEPATFGDDQGWVIPTSGHRCYPSRVYPIDNLVAIDNPQGRELVADILDVSHLPDHYSVNDRRLTAPTERQQRSLSVADVFGGTSNGDHD